MVVCYVCMYLSICPLSIAWPCCLSPGSSPTAFSWLPQQRESSPAAAMFCHTHTTLHYFLHITSLLFFNSSYYCLSAAAAAAHLLLPRHTAATTSSISGSQCRDLSRVLAAGVGGSSSGIKSCCCYCGCLLDCLVLWDLSRF